MNPAMPDHTAATLFGAWIARMRLALSFLWRLEARFKGVEFQGKVEFQGRPIISVASGGRMVLGDGVRIASAVRANPLGLSQPSVLRAMAPGAQLILGPGVGLSGAVLCAGSSIEIGEQTILGAGAMVIDNDFHVPSGEFGWATDVAGTARPIRIGRGVFVGARAIILKGVTVGDRAIVGAGAVVAKDVPSGHVAVGNPAQALKRGGGHAALSRRDI
jgi:acetyltransferase-like isoleucine patch superfamily enzyme